MSDNDTPKNLIEWLGFKAAPDYSKARLLGTMLGVLFCLLLLLVLVMAAMALYQFFIAVSGNLEDSHEAIRNIGLVIAALFGVPFLIWRSVVAQKQVDVAEQSHITDRISKAVEQLGAAKTVRYHRTNGNGIKLYEEREGGGLDLKKPIFSEETKPNIEVRMGGIFALERIGRDSPADHLQIMEILTAYIRENAPASGAENPPGTSLDVENEATLSGHLSSRLHPSFKLVEQPKNYGFGNQLFNWPRNLKPRNDIQGAITVIGRRDLILSV
ncbi:MAG: hypothetical protein ACI861_002533 [Paracoccaceae bacterium]|jgi:hypothetical protein